MVGSFFILWGGRRRVLMSEVDTLLDLHSKLASVVRYYDRMLEDRLNKTYANQYGAGAGGYGMPSHVAASSPYPTLGGGAPSNPGPYPSLGGGTASDYNPAAAGGAESFYTGRPAENYQPPPPQQQSYPSYAPQGQAPSNPYANQPPPPQQQGEYAPPPPQNYPSQPPQPQGYPSQAPPPPIQRAPSTQYAGSQASNSPVQRRVSHSTQQLPPPPQQGQYTPESRTVSVIRWRHGIRL